MNKQDRIKIRLKYESICHTYIDIFVKKHGYEFSHWIADEIGDVACFIEQYFFNFNDIRYDIDNNIPKGRIFEWQNYCSEQKPFDSIINYQNYLKLNK
jgi:hypothetical protein